MATNLFPNASDFSGRENSKKEEYISYVEKHPELKQIMSDFLGQVLLDKPEDILRFAKSYFQHYAPRPTKESPLIICGPSGVGKGTLTKKLFEEFGEKLGISVSHTTRAPREGEVNGKHYHFVPKEIFEKEIEEGLFIEHAHVHNNIYGTSYQSVRDVVSGGKVCVLEIDFQGAAAVKKSDLAPRVVFIAPPSLGDLEKRLRHRGTESQEEIEVRMQNAKNEIDWLDTPENTDCKIVNDDLEQAYERLKGQLMEWYPQLSG
mmetsp:Transcript_9843/g.11221  ORF Transcript_9843/g.11221 Transcript_9843/m.11221 type:complete len:261 (-) Transcript_9843:1524-2306(-)